MDERLQTQNPSPNSENAGGGAADAAQAAKTASTANPAYTSSNPTAADAATADAPAKHVFSPDDMPDEELLYDLADLFKVFSDTTRIKILFALMGGEMSVGEIAEATGSSQSAVSHQLRTLKQARLVKFERDGRSILYSLADDHVYTMLNQGMSHICE